MKPHYQPAYVHLYIDFLICYILHFSGFWMCLLSKQGGPYSSVFKFWNHILPIQILKSTFVRNICNLSSEVYRDIEVSFFFKISIPLRSCLVFSYLKWRIISPFARSGDGIFTSIYHANSAAKVSMTPKLRGFKEKQRCIYF